ncbi:hypothetical protein AB0E78_41425 [Streptomyces sp. NPDC032198]|uniref:hypothetical protein n=1 Tax=Streptomyces sp. NPDC032198 TaxID=3155127 RepID=UPI0033DE6CE7
MRSLGGSWRVWPRVEVVAVAWRVVRWAPALALGALWWWGVLRLALVPGAGVLEGAVAAGGWGLSLLPVHCVPWSRAVSEAKASRAARGARASRVSGFARFAGRDRRPDGGPESGERSGGRTAGGAARSVVGAVTTAWRRRRSGGGSGPS